MRFFASKEENNKARKNQKRCKQARDGHKRIVVLDHFTLQFSHLRQLESCWIRSHRRPFEITRHWAWFSSWKYSVAQNESALETLFTSRTTAKSLLHPSGLAWPRMPIYDGKVVPSNFALMVRAKSKIVQRLCEQMHTHTSITLTQYIYSTIFYNSYSYSCSICAAPCLAK